MATQHDDTEVRDEQLADVPKMGGRGEPVRISRRAWVGRFTGPILAVLVFLVLPTGDGGLSLGGRATVAIGLLMAVWWVTEALPLAATALLPLMLFPMTGVLGIEDAAAPYANDLIFLFMGGFMLALAMQRWGLHRRITLQTIRAVGTKPKAMIGGFMIATGVLSMWVSNTATTVMMLPIGLAVLKLVFDRMDHVDSGDAEAITGRGAPNFATALMLGIAFAASIGSLGTIIGTRRTRSWPPTWPRTTTSTRAAPRPVARRGLRTVDAVRRAHRRWSSSRSPGSSSLGSTRPRWTRAPVVVS